MFVIAVNTWTDILAFIKEIHEASTFVYIHRDKGTFLKTKKRNH